MNTDYRYIRHIPLSELWGDLVRFVDMPTDDELYRLFFKGDASAGDELMLRLGDTLISYLNMYVKNLQDAEDLMLDCFTVILVDKPKIKDGAFKAYLFRIAHNKAYHLWKKKYRHSEIPFPEDISSEDAFVNSTILNEIISKQDPSKQMQPEDLILNRERNDLLYKSFEKLSPIQKDAVWLVYMMDFSYKDVATILGCTTKKIDNLLSGAKKILRAELTSAGINL